MIVYHGTTLEIKKPEIITSETGRDFGFAFYTTDIKDQAERWAIRKALIANRLNGNGLEARPIVNVYEWDDSIPYSRKDFADPSMDWLEMVINCRSNVDFKHDFDIVTGKIANDRVGETISYVIEGIMRKEDAIERLKFEQINNQIAFCSPESLESLKFIESYEVK